MSALEALLTVLVLTLPYTQDQSVKQVFLEVPRQIALTIFAYTKYEFL